MSPQRFRRPAILLLALHLHACTSWQATPVSPQPPLGDQASARITTLDGSRIEVLQPRIEGDSILGINEVSQDCEFTTLASVCQETTVEDLSFPLADVQLLEVKRSAPLRTFGVIVGGAVALLGLLYVVGCSGDEGGLGSPC